MSDSPMRRSPKSSPVSWDFQSPQTTEKCSTNSFPVTRLFVFFSSAGTFKVSDSSERHNYYIINISDQMQIVIFTSSDYSSREMFDNSLPVTRLFIFFSSAGTFEVSNSSKKQAASYQKRVSWQGSRQFIQSTSWLDPRYRSSIWVFSETGADRSCSSTSWLEPSSSSTKTVLSPWLVLSFNCQVWSKAFRHNKVFEQWR